MHITSQLVAYRYRLIFAGALGYEIVHLLFYLAHGEFVDLWGWQNELDQLVQNCLEENCDY
jgi:hypothetical protein